MSDHLTCLTFLGTFTGHHVALIREKQSKIIGTLVAIDDSGDPDHPELVVDTGEDHHRRVPFTDVTRVKFHFTPTDKDRQR